MNATLIDRLRTMAADRIRHFRSLDFDALQSVRADLVELRGRWLSRGTVWNHIEKIDDETLRVAVLQGAEVPWWPSYYHNFDGFRVRRDGTKTELTQEDHYDLD